MKCRWRCPDEWMGEVSRGLMKTRGRRREGNTGGAGRIGNRERGSNPGNQHRESSRGNETLFSAEREIIATSEASGSTKVEPRDSMWLHIVHVLGIFAGQMGFKKVSRTPGPARPGPARPKAKQLSTVRFGLTFVVLSEMCNFGHFFGLKGSKIWPDFGTGRPT